MRVGPVTPLKALLTCGLVCCLAACHALGPGTSHRPHTFSCEPHRPLTWKDFQGVDRAAPWAAETAIRFAIVQNPHPHLIALFEPSFSWIRPGLLQRPTFAQDADQLLRHE